MRHHSAPAFASTLALALLLAACGDNTNETTITDSESGESLTLRTADDPDEGIAPPADLPAFAPIYPGGVITASVTGKPGEAQGMVAFTTADSADEVIAFYRERGKAAGLSEQGEMNMSGTRILSMGAGDAAAAAMQVTVSPLDEESRRMVQIVYAAQGA
ncbi:hypothetical protein [Erythrobacter cryptus]|uniref:hypothetical protein n=1 Tax=Erythrobacter cryptus TaxID=196588 RepID=UPI0004104328|nr:hypothetical protein [Erythrobacter cryptus]